MKTRLCHGKTMHKIPTHCIYGRNKGAAMKKFQTNEHSIKLFKLLVDGPNVTIFVDKSTLLYDDINSPTGKSNSLPAPFLILNIF